MVHSWMLPRPQQHLDDRECHHHAQGATRGAELLMAGDLNGIMSETEGDQRREEIAAVLTTAGM